MVIGETSNGFSKSSYEQAEVARIIQTRGFIFFWKMQWSRDVLGRFLNNGSYTKGNIIFEKIL